MPMRSTTDGQIRFDNTMRVLKQIMPSNQFRVLCNKINRAREVSNEPTSSKYVTPDTYAPMTLEKYTAEQLKDIDRLSTSTVKRRLANILAARDIAKTRRSELPQKAIVIKPSQQKAEEASIKLRAEDIRRNPAMDNLARNFADPDTQRMKIQSWRVNGGAQLEEAYKWNKQNTAGAQLF